MFSPAVVALEQPTSDAPVTPSPGRIRFRVYDLRSMFALAKLEREELAKTVSTALS